MATARKCDRCGKYYDENKKYRYDLTMGTVIGLRFETRQGFNSSRIDLCDECLGKIKEFLGTDILKERE
jgi:hypothetical protein